MPAVQVTTLTIQQLGPKGDGTHAGPRGRVFIDRALPGDQIRAKLFKDAAGVARGEILEVLSPSRLRQNPPCKHYDRCGSCTLQHLKPDYYREWKTQLVIDAFRKQNLNPRFWLEPVFLGQQNRRRATFTALKKTGKVVMGYYRRRSDEIADIEQCLIADPRLLEIQKKMKPLLRGILSEGEPTDIFLQLAANGVDMVITGPVGRAGHFDAGVRQALAPLSAAVPVTRVSWRESEKDQPEVVWSRGEVTGKFGSLTVSLPPASFLQPTLEGEKALVQAVLEALPQKRGMMKFADLFSGCGTFTGPLLERGHVDAYESLPRAVSALSKAGDPKKLKVFRRDLFRQPLRREEINRYDAVIFDPPRAGCTEQAAAMASARTRMLIGVSCNPATFARDARTLCDGGYRLHSLKLIDQFLWSHHVEMVGVFTK